VRVVGSLECIHLPIGGGVRLLWQHDAKIGVVPYDSNDAKAMDSLNRKSHHGFGDRRLGLHAQLSPCRPVDNNEVLSKIVE